MAIDSNGKPAQDLDPVRGFALSPRLSMPGCFCLMAMCARVWSVCGVMPTSLSAARAFPSFLSPLLPLRFCARHATGDVDAPKGVLRTQRVGQLAHVEVVGADAAQPQELECVGRVEALKQIAEGGPVDAVPAQVEPAPEEEGGIGGWKQARRLVIAVVVPCCP